MRRGSGCAALAGLPLGAVKNSNTLPAPSRTSRPRDPVTRRGSPLATSRSAPTSSHELTRSAAPSVCCARVAGAAAFSSTAHASAAARTEELLRHVRLVPGRVCRVAAVDVLRELEVGAVIPLHRQRRRSRQVLRIFDGDLVTPARLLGSARQPLDHMLARA